MTLKTSPDQARRRLIDELLDEFAAWSPSERIRAFQRWLRGSLSLIQLNVLTILEVEDGLPTGRLAEAIGVSVASATGIVDRMVDRGLVERRPGTADRRVVEVHLTPAGSAIFTGLLAERRAHLEGLLDRLSARELRSLLVGTRALHRARREHAAAGTTGAHA